MTFAERLKAQQEARAVREAQQQASLAADHAFNTEFLAPYREALRLALEEMNAVPAYQDVFGDSRPVQVSHMRGPAVRSGPSSKASKPSNEYDIFLGANRETGGADLVIDFERDDSDPWGANSGFFLPSGTVEVTVSSPEAMVEAVQSAIADYVTRHAPTAEDKAASEPEPQKVSLIERFFGR